MAKQLGTVGNPDTFGDSYDQQAFSTLATRVEQWPHSGDSPHALTNLYDAGVTANGEFLYVLEVDGSLFTWARVSIDMSKIVIGSGSDSFDFVVAEISPVKANKTPIRKITMP